jgi:hypothetical protein
MRRSGFFDSASLEMQAFVSLSMAPEYGSNMALLLVRHSSGIRSSFAVLECGGDSVSLFLPHYWAMSIEMTK